MILLMQKREQNKAIVKERLINEALRLFSENGFEQTTVTDIVLASEIGRGTFYNYFPDVKAIFDAVIDRSIYEIQLLATEARKEAKGLYGLLYASFKSYFDFVSSDRQKEFHKKNLAYIRSTSYGSESLKRMISDLQEDLKSSKYIDHFKTEQEVQMLSFVLMGTSAELFLSMNAASLNFSNHDIATFFATLYTKGLETKNEEIFQMSKNN